MKEPTDDPTDRASRMKNKKMICTLTIFSTAVRFIGVALFVSEGLKQKREKARGKKGKATVTHVAFLINFVS